MTRTTRLQMLTDPYILEVLRELEELGHEGDEAKKILLRYYRPVRRVWGLEPNARDFAREIESVNQAVNRKYDPNDPDQIFIGDLKGYFRNPRLKGAKNRILVKTNKRAYVVSPLSDYIGTSMGSVMQDQPSRSLIANPVLRADSASHQAKSDVIRKQKSNS
jgi:hypothetical protein